MTWLKVFGLYYRTLKYLRIKQIYHRVRRAIYKPKLPRLSDSRDMIIRKLEAPSKFPNKHDSLLDYHKFRFLNKTIELKFPVGWDQANIPLLWLYNLHYFDGLLGKNTTESLKESLVERWIRDNSSSMGVACRNTSGVSSSCRRHPSWGARVGRGPSLWLTSLPLDGADHHALDEVPLQERVELQQGYQCLWVLQDLP